MRNRIMKEVSGDAIIHFLDADVLPTCPHPAKILRSIDMTTYGVIGGLVTHPNGEQDMWNFGPAPHILTILSVIFYGAMRLMRRTWLGKKLMPLFIHRPQLEIHKNEPHPYWVVEANMAIRLSTFRTYGGFDELIREHDIQPLAYRLHEAGIKNLFVPELSVRRRQVNVRSYNRLLASITTELYIVRTYIGWKRYFFKQRF